MSSAPKRERHRSVPLAGTLPVVRAPPPVVLHLPPVPSDPPGSTVRTTYLEIPQAARTWDVLISRPFWMWGAEIGANQHGVVIGNEAVFTDQPYADEGLTGMDLLRLARDWTVDRWA